MQFLSSLPGCTYMLAALIVEVALLFQALLFIGFCNLLKPFGIGVFFSPWAEISHAYAQPRVMKV